MRHLDLPILRRAYLNPRALAGLAKRWLRTLRLLRTTRPALVYLTTSAAYLCAPAARLAGVPQVIGHKQEMWSSSDAAILGLCARACHRLIACPVPPATTSRIDCTAGPWRCSTPPTRHAAYHPGWPRGAPHLHDRQPVERHQGSSHTAGRLGPHRRPWTSRRPGWSAAERSGDRRGGARNTAAGSRQHHHRGRGSRHRALPRCDRRRPGPQRHSRRVRVDRDRGLRTGPARRRRRGWGLVDIITDGSDGWTFAPSTSTHSPESSLASTAMRSPWPAATPAQRTKRGSPQSATPPTGVRQSACERPHALTHPPRTIGSQKPKGPHEILGHEFLVCAPPTLHAPRPGVGVIGMTEANNDFATNLSRLRSAQKPSFGTAAYGRYVNRPAGRLIAAFAHKFGLTPNGATAISAALSASGLVLLAVADRASGRVSAWQYCSPPGT